MSTCKNPTGIGANDCSTPTSNTSKTERIKIGFFIGAKIDFSHLSTSHFNWFCSKPYMHSIAA
jgi:hypothetical protein